MPQHKDTLPISVDRIAHSILVLRGHKVLLDADLTALYDVETGVLVQVVKRNLERFSENFMLQLTAEEWAALKPQSLIKRYRNHARGCAHA